MEDDSQSKRGFSQRIPIGTAVFIILSILFALGVWVNGEITKRENLLFTIISRRVLPTPPAEVFQPAISTFSCSDVFRAQQIELNPKTGGISNQFDRREMVETRSFNCFWRAYRYAQEMRKASPPALHAQIDIKLNQATNAVSRALTRYQNATVRTLRAKKNASYMIGQASYAWIYPSAGMGAMKEALALNPEWVRQNPNQEILNFLNAKYENGKIVSAKLKSTNAKKGAGQGKEEIRKFGVIHNRMKFPVLTDEMKNQLDNVHSLHDEWTKAILSRRDANEIQRLVMEHHMAHAELESMATTPEQLILLRIQTHTPHEVCWDRPKNDVDTLATTVNAVHAKWVQAVKELNFFDAWGWGLQHARLHTLLSTCNILLPDIPGFEVPQIPLAADVEEGEETDFEGAIAPLLE